MFFVIFLTLIFGVFERVGVPRFLTIPYVIAFVSGSKEFGTKYVGTIFVSGLVFDLVWQSRLGVSSFLFIVCLVILDQLRAKFGNQVLWLSGLISIALSSIYFVLNNWPIVWWQLIIIYFLTIVFGRLINTDRGVRGEVFLRRS